MASYRKLPSGRWQATVSLPLKSPTDRARRLSKTHPHKAVVREWATALEAAIAGGTWLDAKGAEVTLGEFRDEWAASRIADAATVKKNASHWKNHVEPVWGGYPLGLITRPQLKSWVHAMHTETCLRCRQRPGVEAGRSGTLVAHETPSGRRCSGSGEAPGLGAWTIQAVVAHLSGLLSAAVEDGRLPANPAAGLNLPTAAPKPIFYWTQDEAAALLLELGGADALAVELDLYVGLRPGELFGLRRRYVDLSMGLLHVHGVATRDGWRPYAKTTMSHRAVPIPRHLRPRLAAHVAHLDPDDTVFPAPRGGLWNDRNFARRVFTPAIERAGVSAGTPYDMRHTAASWLVQRGVPLLDVQQLLGHEKYATTLRYAHLKPGEFGSVLDAWGDAPLDPRGSAAERPTAPQPHDGAGQRKRPRLD